MKQIMLHGANDWRLDDIPDAQPGPRDALVRIAACGICGTDVSYVHMGLIPGHPIPLGHEMAGVVEWVGGEVAHVAVGDRVIVCPSDLGSGTMGTGGSQGGLTPLLHVPEVATGRLLLVPEAGPAQQREAHRGHEQEASEQQQGPLMQAAAAGRADAHPPHR